MGLGQNILTAKTPEQADALIAERAKRAPSASRSDDAAAALERHGVGVDRLAQKLNQLLDAKVWRHGTKYDEKKRCMVPCKDLIDDFKTQLAAFQHAADIHGLKFIPSRTDAGQVPPYMLTIINDFRTMVQTRNPREVAEASGLKLDVEGKIVQ